MKRLIAGTALSLLCVLPFAQGASAHDDVTSTTPSAGAVITSPREVTLTFSEELNPDLVTGVLKSATGEEIQLTSARNAGGTTVALDVPEVLADGLWTVKWAATSRDTHQVSGAFAFTVVSEGASTQSTPQTSSQTPKEPIDREPVSPFVLLGLSVAILVGLAFGVSAARPRRG
jgi:copper transport protein